MRSIILFCLIAMLAILPACKKSSSFSGAKVYVLTDFKAGVIYTYNYNSDGTAAAIQKNVGGKTTFQYSTGNVLMSSINANNVTGDAMSFTLNSSGYAQSSQGQFQSQNLSSDYTYDGSGHLIEQKNYRFGNLASHIVYSFPSTVATERDSLNATTGIHYYDYYAYVTNITNSMGVQNRGESFLGVSSNNPISIDYKVNQAGDTTDIISYRYKYDGSSRVDTLSSHNRNGQLIDSMAFSYY